MHAGPEHQNAAKLDTDDVAFVITYCILARELYPDTDWETVEPRLEQGWLRVRGDSTASWQDVRQIGRARWMAGSGDTIQ
ncbi:MAG: hypothetical protein ACREPE_01475 [Lysobacter sp.]